LAGGKPEESARGGWCSTWANGCCTQCDPSAAGQVSQGCDDFRAAETSIRRYSGFQQIVAIEEAKQQVIKNGDLTKTTLAVI